jgi:hypothetical protein
MEVAEFLEDIDLALSIRYIEYLISERKEKDPAFHDRLAELYFHAAQEDHDKREPFTRSVYYRD